ncbi:MAG: META domain-containing protein [Ilumatobacteraceae bacterium]
MAAPLRSFSFAFVATAALLFAACGSDTTSITGGTEETGATATANTATIGSDALPDTEPLTADTVDTPATTEPSTTQPTSGTGFGQSDADRQRMLATNWSARRFITVGPLDEIPTGSTAGFRFLDERTISVDTGCNTGTGTVTFGPGGTMSISKLGLTKKACPDDTESKLVALLGLDLVWSVDGDQLTIYPLSVTDLGLIVVDADTIETTPTATATPEQAVAADRADVIAAAVLARVTVDNSFGGQDTFTAVTIVQIFGEPTADAMITIEADGPRFTDAERAAVEASLAPLPVHWTDDPQDPSALTAQAAGQRDAIVTISEPVVTGDSATIVTGLFCGELCAIGGAHELGRQADGTWIITGHPGPQWIS